MPEREAYRASPLRGRRMSPKERMESHVLADTAASRRIAAARESLATDAPIRGLPLAPLGDSAKVKPVNPFAVIASTLQRVVRGKK